MGRITTTPRRRFASWLALLLASVAIAPASAALAAPHPTTALSVTVVVPPQKWLVERLAGDAVETVVLVEPGMSHETAQIPDRVATAVMRTKLLFGVGLGVEAGRWLEPVRRTGTPRFIDTRAGIALRVLEGHAHHHEHQPGHVCGVDEQDPHIWTAPANLRAMARTMAEAMIDEAPQLRERIEPRLASLEEELAALDADLRRILEPVRGRAFFIFHPAWGYLADAYGLRQVAIEREGKPPTDHELTELQRQARAEGIRVVFVQPQISSRAADAVAATVGGRVESIDPLVEDVPANLRRVAEAIARSVR